MKNTLIAPSVLAADFANLQRDIEMINNSEADWFHIDIMDGVFVPNISFGMPVLDAINKHAKKTIDVHLMIVNPGFGGQSFIENTYDKVRKLKALITKKNANTLIEIDGGVTNKNAKALVDAGADVLVAGSYVFGAANPTATIADLKVITR